MGKTNAVRHGIAYRHPGQLGISGKQVNTVALSFPDGTQVGVTVNSVPDPTGAVWDAYTTSWVPIQ